METAFDLTDYLNRGAKELVRDILRATLQNPRETAFLRRYRNRQKAMEARRAAQEAQGRHIPMFLIASITNACNLHCKGCYARANGQCGDACGDAGGEAPLTAQEWGGVFGQAEALGIPFILLAGGEPMLRPEVLQQAAQRQGMLYPIFTNGTLLGGELLTLLDAHRNLVPVVSLEGGQATTDARRGEGAFSGVQAALGALAARKLLFGVSITLTTQNRAEAMSPAFLEQLASLGCRLVFYIEYVPVAPGTEALAPDDTERLVVEEALGGLREQFPGMVFLAFPGDEKHMGGCLAAGRGFFHINAHGGAEPCPFSPFSDVNIRDRTLLEVLQSPFFTRVRALNALADSHAGGCALFMQEAQVKALL